MTEDTVQMEVLNKGKLKMKTKHVSKGYFQKDLCFQEELQTETEAITETKDISEYRTLTQVGTKYRLKQRLRFNRD